MTVILKPGTLYQNPNNADHWSNEPFVITETESTKPFTRADLPLRNKDGKPNWNNENTE